jgi:16S rRNA (uracil1498-N3)-methyltransferase
MQRYFIEPGQFEAGEVRILGDDAHHLARVMRAEPGDRIICSNGVDREVLAAIREVGKSEVVADVVEERVMSGEAACGVWIAQSLPKGDKLETVIQKCTEIGAARFLPFQSERTVVQYDGKKEAKRVERWQKIAKEAAEQAHRSRVPAVDSPFTWRELMKLVPEADLALICYEKEGALQLKRLLGGFFADKRGIAPGGGSGDAGRVLLLVGPEGGFTEKEVSEAEAAGCRSVSLGKRILRTETAAMAALTCILYESGEMGE